MIDRNTIFVACGAACVISCYVGTLAIPAFGYGHWILPFLLAMLPSLLVTGFVPMECDSRFRTAALSGLWAIGTYCLTVNLTGMSRRQFDIQSASILNCAWQIGPPVVIYWCAFWCWTLRENRSQR